MKKFLLPLVAVLLLSFTASENKLTEAERDFAIFELNKSRELLLTALDGLTEAQLNYKSSPESWSIAECVEHIAISENNIFGMMQGNLKSEADASRRAEVKMNDEQVLKVITDRSNKVKTQEPFEPTGKFGSFEKTLKNFKEKRADNMKYVLTTEDDLRNRYAVLPFGTLDLYQVILFMSGHTERHVLQIREIMEDADFPQE
ncbi:DinB family protein [Altibacter sp.]|uniref:DinB family protein n=1 Tax=Altibacter sp. TaxID=2024823 RepID=UPI00258631EB|nr:DinB family protein [Altibacter sp.]MCW9038075.1 DinB family protein [Altibacter sp.]